MFDIPIHPLIVHFPIVFAVLLPLAALAAILAGFRLNGGRKFWIGVVVIHAVLVGSGYLAVQTGESEEEKVEKVLASEAPLESHGEKGELFVQVAAAALVVSALGLASGSLGLYARILGGLASILILVMGMQVGHSGGQLVYKHGAASAYLAGNAGGPGQPNSDPGGGGGDNDDDD